MCGVLAIATCHGTPLPLTDSTIATMRDTMAHRGPDGAGAWWSPGRGVCLAHRRLAVLGLGHAADQPMVLAGRVNGPLLHDHLRPPPAAPIREPATGPDTIALAYNGEWFDEPAHRRAMQRRGIRFETTCDTETLLRRLSEFGDATLDDLRGMFALAWHDHARRTLTIARDPLGIKPLYWCRLIDRGIEQVVVASEPIAILAHPAMTPRPDPGMVSAYISHSRAVLGDRTMFLGVRALEPGEIIRFDLAGPTIRERRRRIPLMSARADGPTGTEAASAVRRAVRSSVFRHLRSEVPCAAMLSGGLDSSIIAAVARERCPAIPTFAADAFDEHSEHSRTDPMTSDAAAADAVARSLKLPHERITLDGDRWLEGWNAMIQHLGVPMSTPNEVAIWSVARRIRATGRAVALSGEGADELFLGYALPLHQIAAGVADGSALIDPAGFAAELGAWVPTHHKIELLRSDFWESAEHDAARRAACQRALDESSGWFAADGANPAMARQAAALGRLNLSALLRRLDTATMLAGVEGRVPLADRLVARAALRIPLGEHFTDDPEGPQTKRVLRRAFADEVPGFVMRRAKASFPVPFQRWLAEADAAAMVSDSGFLRCVYENEALDMVAADPRGQWMLAWPMANLAVWAQRWGWDDRTHGSQTSAAAARG